MALALADCGARAPVARKPDFPPPPPRFDAGAVRALRGICLEEFTIPTEIPETAAREKAFVELLRAELARANVRLVGKDETAAVYGRACRKAGGTFDRDTGAAETVQFDKARRAGLTALRSELRCDATMTAGLLVVRSIWEKGVARWDGVSQPVPGAGADDGGLVPTLSFWMYINDLDDREIYFGAGGVQVLMGLKKRGPYAASEGAVVDAKTVLASEELNRKSVEVALEAFLGARAGGDEPAVSDVVAPPAAP